MNKIYLVARDTTPDVELIGGPLCGSTYEWPAGEDICEYQYHGGLATYKYEQEGKALYEKG